MVKSGADPNSISVSISITGLSVSTELESYFKVTCRTVNIFYVLILNNNIGIFLVNVSRN